MKRRLCVSMLAVLLSACGGGGPSPAAEGGTRPVPQQQAAADPTTSMLRVWQAYYGRAPTYAEFTAITTSNSETFATSLFTALASTSDSALATRVLTNMGVTSQTVNASSLSILQTALTQYFAAYGNGARGVIANNLVRLLAGLESDATWGNAARGFNTTIANTRTKIANETPGACTPNVAQGFQGNIETTPPEGGAGDGGSAGSAGASGVGGGFGKVLGGTLTMIDLSNGTTIGQAVTDSTQGLVSVKACGKPGPFLLVLEGRAGAKYFDEGRNSLVDFPVGTAMHAIVTTWNEHVGVSPYTEAATRYAIATYRGIRDAHTLTTGQVRSALVGLTAAQVSQSNAVVLEQVNAAAVTTVKMASVNTLPTPIDTGSASTALSQNRYGVAATVLGGFVNAISRAAPAEPAPALAGARALAEDFTDGVLNGWSAAGRPVLSEALLESQRIGFGTMVGQNIVSSKFGSAIFNSMPLIVEVGSAPSELSYREARFALQRDRSVVLSTITTAPSTILRDAGAITPSLNVALVQMLDGTLMSWGRRNCGITGHGAMGDTFTLLPALVSGLRNLRSVAATHHTAYAVDSAGDVYSWGSDIGGALGLPSTVARTSCTLYSGDSSTGIASPRKIPTLSNIRAVMAGQVVAFAITADGRVYNWGYLPTGTTSFRAVGTPTAISGLSNVVQIASGWYDAVALTTDGTAYGWGRGTISRYLGSGDTPVETPRRLPGLEGMRVVQVASDTIGRFVFLLSDGTIRRLDPANGVPALWQPMPGSTRQLTLDPRNPTDTARGNWWLNVNGAIPLIRQIATTFPWAWLYARDGSIYHLGWDGDGEGFFEIDPNNIGRGLVADFR